MKWNREEFLNYMTTRDSKHAPMFSELMGLLVGLDKEWEEQGATPEELNLSTFGFDYMDREFCGGNTNIYPSFPVRMIEDNDEYAIRIDEYGRTAKLMKKSASIYLPQDYPVTDWESWNAIKPHFQPHPDRIEHDQIAKAKKRREEGALVWADIPGAFDLPRQLMGEENVCIAFYDDPELIKDILNTAKETCLWVFEQVLQEVQIDVLHIHEDMAGNMPLVGPNIVKKFFYDYYRGIWDYLHERGCTLFFQDSDGNMNPVMDAFVECGVNVFYPCEPNAGMDIVQMREKYGDGIYYMGGIDKFVLKKSKEEIRKELEYKLQPSMRTGGVIFGIDHRIVNGTPLENYRYYVKTAREILGLPPMEEVENGWDETQFEQYVLIQNF